MNLSRLAYRSHQFWKALLGSRKRVEREISLPYLSPTQIALFQRMQPFEQAHAFQVFEILRTSGQGGNRDLLVAALLHDVGKILYPLSVWERVAIVLGKRLFPNAISRWGQGQLSGIRHPFVVAARHAGWGADLAARAGVTSRTVDLIRRHQDLSPSDDPLLAALQKADDIE